MDNELLEKIIKLEEKVNRLENTVQKKLKRSDEFCKKAKERMTTYHQKKKNHVNNLEEENRLLKQKLHELERASTTFNDSGTVKNVGNVMMW